MSTLIQSAIQSRHLLHFTYDCEPRTVEPHQLGRSSVGDLILSAWQVGGHTHSGHQPPWRQYRVSEMRNIQILDEAFTGTRPGYKKTPNDIFRTAIAQL